MSSDDDAEEDDDWFTRALGEGADVDARSDDDVDAVDDSDADAVSGDDATEDTVGEESSVEGRTDDPVDASGGGEDPLGEDFATAFRNTPAFGGEGEGMATPTGAGGGFEEESFESDISRIDVGIDGLDDMIQKGVPERSLMASIGSAGTGKTTFGLQFIHHGLERGESAVFITLEEGYERIMRSADEKGWRFSEHEAEGKLAVVDLDPIEMANSLTSIRSELPDLVREFGASRLVLDSVSLLEMMYDDQATRRNEIYDFAGSLKRAGVTTMLTSEASEDDPYHSRFGIIEYLTDAVFVLQYVRPEDFQETRLAVEIQKIRDANHSRETKPYELNSDGIDVYQEANIF